jgi:hypothetical protein
MLVRGVPRAHWPPDRATEKTKSCDPCQVQTLQLAPCREHCATGKLVKGRVCRF